MNHIKRRFIGDWVFQSGNDITVYFEEIPGDGTYIGQLDVRWERVPPSEADLAEYLEKILGEIALKVFELCPQIPLFCDRPNPKGPAVLVVNPSIRLGETEEVR